MGRSMARQGRAMHARANRNSTEYWNLVTASNDTKTSARTEKPPSELGHIKSNISTTEHVNLRAGGSLLWIFVLQAKSSSSARAPTITRCTSNESRWKKCVEESCHLQVPKKVGGTFERDRSNTICSARTIVQCLQIPLPAIPQPAMPDSQDHT